MYKLKSNEQVTKEEDKELKELKEHIEKYMFGLSLLQEKHNKLVGKDHVMDLYLCTPKHLQGITT
jgi:hypothetical protein